MKGENTTMQTRLYEAWKHTLKLSALKPGENVVIVNSWGRGAQYKDIAAMACESLGASVTYAEVPDKDRLPTGIAPLFNAADLIIDLVFVHDRMIYAAREHGTRILVALEPPEVLLRLLPQLEDKERALEAVAMLRASKTMRITSAAGTDLTFDLGQYRVNSQYGFSDEPGKWDQWPGVFVNTYANDGTGSGTVVVDAGDMVFPFNRYFSERVSMEVDKGFITKITGGYEAELLRAYMERFGTRDVYGLSHMGWGLSRDARWEFTGLHAQGALEGQDARAFPGNFLFSTGPNLNGGGTRKTDCHLDIPMRGCTIELDGVPVVVEGRLAYGKERQIAAE